MQSNIALTQAEELLAYRRVDEASGLFDAAEQFGADPDQCAGGRWFCWMLQGKFENAWQQSDVIRRRGSPDPNRFWNGEPLHGRRVMLRCLHGYGDAIQLLRYAPTIRQQTLSLVVEVPPALLELARCFPGIDEVVTWDSDAPEHVPRWDLQLEILELPYIFRSSIESLPAHIPYLQLSPPLVLLLPDRKPRIGLFWTGGDWNATRSLPFAILKPLLENKQVSFWSLQSPGNNREWFQFCSQHRLPANNHCAPGLLSLAQLISQMDLVISIDSVAAHLAGALGKPVWTLLNHFADWRWMLDRAVSPWYPTMRLFRQPREGDWKGMIDEVHFRLKQLLSSMT